MRMTAVKMSIFVLLGALLSMGAVACAGGEEERRDEDEMPTEEPAEAETREVTLYEYRFNPQELTITQGTEIVFENKDPDRHNVNIPALDIDEDLPSGSSFSHVFETTGEFAVSNRFASSPMKMTIVVEEQ